MTVVVTVVEVVGVVVGVVDGHTPHINGHDASTWTLNSPAQSCGCRATPQTGGSCTPLQLCGEYAVMDDDVIVEDVVELTVMEVVEVGQVPHMVGHSR